MLRQLSLGRFVCVSLVMLGLAGYALGDGNETLGPPSIAVASGSGMVAAGTGLFTQPGTIAIEVPAGATVKQVLLYWSGRGEVPDDTLVVDGNDVTGVLIGSAIIGNPTATSGSAAFRADITGLGLVGPGPNTLTVGGADFSYQNDGAGVLVIYEDVSGEAIIDLRDGHDFVAAGQGFSDPLDRTVPQTYTFPAAGEDRAAKVILFAGDGEIRRPDAIDYTVGGVTTTLSDDNFVGGDGSEWDTIELAIDIPAGETELTIEIRSISNGTPNTPDSIVWVVSALSIMGEEEGDGEGCTPGYWKQPHHLGNWVNYSPDDLFDDVFGVDADGDKTLLETLWTGGGKANALGRHAVAALLNAASSVDYLYSEAEIIALVQEAYATEDYETAKDLLEMQNEMGCPLDRAEIED